MEVNLRHHRPCLQTRGNGQKFRKEEVVFKSTWVTSSEHTENGLKKVFQLMARFFSWRSSLQKLPKPLQADFNNADFFFISLKKCPI